MSETIQTKRCSHCKQIKPFSEYSKNKQSKYGIQNVCKICSKLYRNPEKNKAYQKLYKQSENGKKAHNRYNYSEKRKVAQKRYGHTEKRKSADKRYRQSKKGYLRKLFCDMLYRCNNPKSTGYKYYGGRGIKVNFKSFDDFYDYVVKELKAEPRGLTIDRIDNDGHYEFGNIRFVSLAENNRNRRPSTEWKWAV